MIRTGERRWPRSTGCSTSASVASQVDLTLDARGAQHHQAHAGERSAPANPRRSWPTSLPLTVFTPEGVDVVRQGPENRRTFLTNLMTDVDPSTGDVIERFARVLSQRNALLRALEGERPTRDTARRARRLDERLLPR